MWVLVRFVCSTIALIAFAIRLAEEVERKTSNHLLCSALTELIAYEGSQVRSRVEELFDTEQTWLRT